MSFGRAHLWKSSDKIFPSFALVLGVGGSESRRSHVDSVTGVVVVFIDPWFGSFSERLVFDRGVDEAECELTHRRFVLEAKWLAVLGSVVDVFEGLLQLYYLDSNHEEAPAVLDVAVRLGTLEPFDVVFCRACDVKVFTLVLAGFQSRLSFGVPTKERAASSPSARPFPAVVCALTHRGASSLQFGAGGNAAARFDWCCSELGHALSCTFNFTLARPLVAAGLGRFVTPVFHIQRFSVADSSWESPVTLDKPSPFVCVVTDAIFSDGQGAAPRLRVRVFSQPVADTFQERLIGTQLASALPPGSTLLWVHDLGLPPSPPTAFVPVSTVMLERFMTRAAAGLKDRTHDSPELVWLVRLPHGAGHDDAVLLPLSKVLLRPPIVAVSREYWAPTPEAAEQSFAPPDTRPRKPDIVCASVDADVVDAKTLRTVRSIINSVIPSTLAASLGPGYRSNTSTTTYRFTMRLPRAMQLHSLIFSVNGVNDASVLKSQGARLTMMAGMTLQPFHQTLLLHDVPVPLPVLRQGGDQSASTAVRMEFALSESGNAGRDAAVSRSFNSSVLTSQRSASGSTDPASARFVTLVFAVTPVSAFAVGDVWINGVPIDLSPTALCCDPLHPYVRPTTVCCDLQPADARPEDAIANLLPMTVTMRNALPFGGGFRHMAWEISGYSPATARLIMALRRIPSTVYDPQWFSPHINAEEAKSEKRCAGCWKALSNARSRSSIFDRNVKSTLKTGPLAGAAVCDECLRENDDYVAYPAPVTPEVREPCFRRFFNGADESSMQDSFPLLGSARWSASGCTNVGPLVLEWLGQLGRDTCPVFLLRCDDRLRGRADPTKPAQFDVGVWCRPSKKPDRGAAPFVARFLMPATAAVTTFRMALRCDSWPDGSVNLTASLGRSVNQLMDGGVRSLTVTVGAASSSILVVAFDFAPEEETRPIDGVRCITVVMNVPPAWHEAGLPLITLSDAQAFGALVSPAGPEPEPQQAVDDVGRLGVDASDVGFKLIKRGDRSCTVPVPKSVGMVAGISVSVPCPSVRLGRVFVATEADGLLPIAPLHVPFAESIDGPRGRSSLQRLCYAMPSCDLRGLPARGPTCLHIDWGRDFVENEVCAKVSVLSLPNFVESESGSAESKANSPADDELRHEAGRHPASVFRACGDFRFDREGVLQRFAEEECRDFARGRIAGHYY